MFAPIKFDGSPMDAEYAAKRGRWEPIHEMTQIKGDEETHPLLSPDDEFADFERWDVGNLSGTVPKTPEMLQYEYARSALRLGLELGAGPRGEPVQARDERHHRRPYRRSRPRARRTTSASTRIPSRRRTGSTSKWSRPKTRRCGS